MAPSSPELPLFKHQPTDFIGPIVRITPDEIHTLDPEDLNDLYISSIRRDKYEWMSGRCGNEGSAFTASYAELHRIRHAPLNPMF